MWALNYTFNVGALRTAAVAASHAAEAIPASAAEFTKNEKAAAQEQFSFVLAFGPAINVSPHDICKAAAAALAPSGLNDHAYITTAHMAFGNMFPTNNPEGINEPRAPHVLTGTGFRLLCETTDRCGPGRCCAPDLG